MPSMILGNPFASGATVVISGNPWSGSVIPLTGIRLTWIGSGQAYIALSGGGPPLSGGFMTVNSGGFQLSGGIASGLLDGMAIPTGGTYFIPKGMFRTSGTFNIFAQCDVASSGVGRLYFEPEVGYPK